MLPADKNQSCPDCASPPTMARRDFIRVMGTTAAVATVGLTPLQKASAARAKKQAQAEAMIFDLYKTMEGEQKKKLVRPWDHGTNNGKGIPSRLRTGNAAVDKLLIGTEYNKTQVEMLDNIFRAIANGDDGYKQLSRNNRFDASGDFESISAIIYGEPTEGKKFSLVFTGHHITVRCDGNSEAKTAFGGPLYYGHSPNGYSPTNVFHKQTKAATELFGALNADQRKVAVMPGKWRDEHGGVKVPGKDDKVPGLAYADMKPDQKELTEKVMKELVSPYRKEDGDEVLEIIKANGGMDKIAMAFYEEGTRSEKEPWSYWRLEGPGFVWSFRALEHVHTFVNINGNLA